MGESQGERDSVRRGVLKLMNSYVKSILHRWEKVTSPSGEVEIKVTHKKKQGKKVCVVEEEGGV